MALKFDFGRVYLTASHQPAERVTSAYRLWIVGRVDPKVVHIYNKTKILLLIKTTTSKRVEYFELNLSV